MRPPLLVDLLDPRPGQAEAGDRTGGLTISRIAMPRFRLDDDVDDDDFDEDEDSDQEDEDSTDDEAEDEEDPEDDVETWQVGTGL